MIVEAIWESFHLKAEVKKEDGVTYIRVRGLDSASLAQWIKSKFTRLEVEYKPHMVYQFSDYDWVKVEYV